MDALSAPDPAHLEIIERWLGQHQITYTRPAPSSTVLLVQTSVRAAEELLATEYRQLSSALTGQALLRAGDVTLPEEVDNVATIFGIHGLPLPERASMQSDADTHFKKGQPITPTVIRELYGIDNKTAYTASNTTKATVNLQGSLLGGVRQTDLEAFFKLYLPEAELSLANWTAQHGDANLVGSKVSVEASMDIQYIKGVAPEVDTEIWNYNDSDFCADLKSWLTEMLQMDAPPLLFSLSYGWQGELDRVGCSAAHIMDIESDLQQAAVRGITVIVSSGDFGAALGGERGAGTAGTFYPAWPASSPWVCSVGATEFASADPKAAPGALERAVSSFGSGGGFSRYPGSSDRKHATWQEHAVQSYLNSSNVRFPKSSDSWSRTGRGTPDVSTLGSPEFDLIVGGFHEQNGGTSAAAPTFAAIVSLLNAARADAGMPAMGLITPFLYQNQNAFTDITDGDNSVNGWWAAKTEGFDAAPGWDPVTGLGTPVFPKLLAAALGKILPSAAPTPLAPEPAPSPAPTRLPTNAVTRPAGGGCSWQTANIKCASDADCASWVSSHCSSGVSEHYCRGNSFCHFQK